MPKFEKEYVYFMWDDKLKGKKVFYADDINTLITDVTDGNDMGIVKEGKFTYAPFEVNCECWKFVYFDPYYDLKIAHDQGKSIQVKNYFTGEWVDKNVDDICWGLAEQYEIRIKPEESKPVTNRELARWLAQGNGEYYEYDCDGWESHRCIEYQYEQDNLPVSKVMVRKWEDEEWHNPTREYLGLE